MSVKNIIVFVFFAISFSMPLKGQKLLHRQGEIIVQFKNDRFLDRFLQDYQLYNTSKTATHVKKISSSPFNLYLLSFDWVNINEDQYLERLRNEHYVVLAQKNHILTLRETPNDPRFGEQWQYLNANNRDLDMDLAWDIATGGITTQNDEIVVAVIDDGFDLTHEDLVDNLWKNQAEIPNNGIDDDNNGYVDDYDGWNVANENDNLTTGDHGLSVCGIVGARGDNNVGVAGMNWNIKIMPLEYGTVTEASAISSYSYAYEMRKRYNDSNGDEGAFVVATNASWGIDEGKAEDAPIWCSFYDELGRIGIINCGATANNNVNVEEDGDLPTSCSSDFLIAVTNINMFDNKVNSAGYGYKSIDLGAYGSGTFTIRPGNGYGSFGGTSGATPHVTGLAALLYATSCGELISLAKSNPSKAALAVKDFILNGVVSNNDLTGITTSGGKLNGKKSMDQMASQCQNIKAPYAFSIETFDLGEMKLDWLGGDNVTVDIRYREIGQTSWTTVTNINKCQILSGLPLCAEFEFQFRSSFTNEWGYSRFKFTSGCCIIPTNINVDYDDHRFNVSFVSDFNSDVVSIEYKKVSDLVWTTADILTSPFQSEYLDGCDTYLVRLRSKCSKTSNESEYSRVYLVNTSCDECNEIDYCQLTTKNNTFEWIESISINGTENVSGKNFGAYQFYGNVFPFDFEVGQNYPVMLAPGYLETPYQEYFKIYIDGNRDGTFDEGEVVYDAGSLTTSPISGEISIPSNITEGYTRLRVLMSYNGPAEACETGTGFSDGEYEDYCIYISNSNCRRISQLFFDNITISSMEVSWSDTGADIYEMTITNNDSGVMTMKTSSTNAINIEALEECTTYTLNIQAYCGNNVSEKSETYIRKTECTSSIGEPFKEESNINAVFSFYGDIKVKYNLEKGQEVRASIFDASGRLLYHNNEFWSPNSSSRLLEVPGLNSGIYFMLFESPHFSESKKLLYLPRH